MRKILPLVMAAMAGFGYSPPGAADGCRRPLVPNNFPEPSTATEQDIVTAQQSVKQYLTDMEAALKCIDAQQHADVEHNMAVDEMQKVAARFNGLVHAFKAKQQT